MLPLCGVYPQVAGAGGVYGQKGEKGEPAVIEPVMIRYDLVSQSKVVQCCANHIFQICVKFAGLIYTIVMLMC